MNISNPWVENFEISNLLAKERLGPPTFCFGHQEKQKVNTIFHLCLELGITGRLSWIFCLEMFHWELDISNLIRFEQNKVFDQIWTLVVFQKNWWKKIKTYEKH